MKTSRVALAAAAGVLLCAGHGAANAADLGGGCCADLEERVAELEATTARKGNRTVTLQVYGQVNKGLLIWDDGVQSDAYVVDSTLGASRFGIMGKAQIKPGWTAGYQMEFEVIDARADTVVQGKNGDDNAKGWPGDGTLNLRYNYLYVESDRLGRISIGQQNAAADGVTEIVLGGSQRSSDVNFGFTLKVQGTGANAGKIVGMWAFNLDPGRDDLVRYDSPSIYGFVLSASLGDNDYADMALRFRKEFDAVRLAAGIGYVWGATASPKASSGNYEELAGSISAMHIPTGVYVAFGAARRDFEDASLIDQSMWYLQGGIEKKILPYGSTTVYGDYGRYEDFASKGAVAIRWGLGVNQKIDAAAMDVYAHATFWSFSDRQPDSEYEDMATVLIGSRIRF